MLHMFRAFNTSQVRLDSNAGELHLEQLLQDGHACSICCQLLV